MRKAILIFLLMVLSHTIYAQYLINKVNEDFDLKNADGSLVLKTTSYTEEGPTSIPENNCRAIIRTKDGKTYKNFKGRIDLRTGKLIFNKNGQELNCNLPVSEILFDSCDVAFDGAYFKSGFPSVDKQTDQSFYHQLVQGRATLLKYYRVNWHDDVSFNSTNTTRVYSVVVFYYLYFEKKMIRLKNNKSDLFSLLPIPGNYNFKKTLDLRKDTDAIQLVSNFNSL